MELYIKTANNGYSITGEYKDNDGNYEEEPYVIQEEEDDKQTTTKLLLLIAELIGHSYNKFEEDNLNITWDKKGHKLD